MACEQARLAPIGRLPVLSDVMQRSKICRCILGRMTALTPTPEVVLALRPPLAGRSTPKQPQLCCSDGYETFHAHWSHLAVNVANAAAKASCGGTSKRTRRFPPLNDRHCSVAEQ